MKRLLLLLSIGLLIISCGQPTQQSETLVQDEVMSYRSMAPMNDMAAGKIMQESAVDQKIIRSANLTYEVNDMDASLKAIEKLLNQYKGVIQTERQYAQADRINTYLSVKVPAKDFESFINALLKGDGIRRIEEKNLSARDVTEDYIDVESRLATKREAMARYRELLQKAETVTDMITVEDKIRRLQEEIESQEARLSYLKDQVDMSEVRINVYQITNVAYIPDKADAFVPQLVRALHGGLKGIVVVFFWLIRLWPIWIGLIIIRIITTIRNRK